MNLNEYQFKTSQYNYGSAYMNPMAITNQKPTIKLKTREDKHTTKENHQTTREETRIDKQRRTTQTTRKLVIKWL